MEAAISTTATVASLLFHALPLRPHEPQCRQAMEAWVDKPVRTAALLPSSIRTGAGRGELVGAMIPLVALPERVPIMAAEAGPAKEEEPVPGPRQGGSAHLAI
ncbi:hypothetical protein D3C87_1732080 [compost metagenome]